MNKKYTLYISVCTIAFASVLFASIAAYEPFAYDGQMLNGQDGGSGFAGAWDSSGFETDVDSLDKPAGFGYSVFGGKIAAHGSGTNAYRELENAIDMDAEGVYYFSTLFSRVDDVDDSGSETVGIIRLYSADKLTQFFAVLGGSAENISITVGTQSAATADDFFDLNKSYLIVAKLVTHSSMPDEVYVKMYEAGRDNVMSEPVFNSDWDLYVTDSVSGLGKQMRLTHSSESGIFCIDEFRLASTWADAVNNTLAGRQKPTSLPFTNLLAAHLDSEHVLVGLDDENKMRAIKMLDMSGKGNDGITGSPDSMPEYVPNAVNGKPALYFDGVDDYLEIASTNDLDSADFAWFIVTAYTADPTINVGAPNLIRSAYADINPDPAVTKPNDYLWGSWLEWVAAENNYYVRSHSRNIAASIKATAVLKPVVQNEWMILETICYSNIDMLRLRVNADYYKAASGIDSEGIGHIRTRICAASGAAAGYFYNGYVAEVLIYSVRLTNDERDAVTAYLANKYNIVIPTVETALYVGGGAAPVDPQTCEQVWANQMGNAADLNFDCGIDLLDYSMFATRWLAE